MGPFRSSYKTANNDRRSGSCSHLCHCPQHDLAQVAAFALLSSLLLFTIYICLDCQVTYSSRLQADALSHCGAGPNLSHQALKKITGNFSDQVHMHQIRSLSKSHSILPPWPPLRYSLPLQCLVNGQIQENEKIATLCCLIALHILGLQRRSHDTPLLSSIRRGA